ncbi:hypothetical protein SEVIR_2G378200v4 [Setaria viridis]|uniref:Subtilisin-like protease n=2 Tax=Setaria viridis TaxID=4556 RepID=A0A4U6WCJ2_SETVI|nr:subtilisin-like protease SBT1.7 [Setaria viridis]TKW35517.1 hypothetical protein SEVIR_2G378200v2 [Setaria viridis]
MASKSPSLLHCIPILLLLAQLAHSVIIPPPSGPSGCQQEHDPQPSSAYIVHTDHLAKPSQFTTPEHWYTAMVASLSPATTSKRIFYVYDTVMHGFAAELTDDEARLLSGTPGVSGVYKDTVVHLHTTRSPGFLGLNKDFGIWPDTDFGDGVIIGFVDTGIWPENPSFDDTGLGPVRPSWKGRCDDGERFNASMCNNKLVGARFFAAGTRPEAVDVDTDFQSPRDAYGHGTHVASTAAGAEVPGAGLFMFARGTATGVAPRARVAMYKACNQDGGCDLTAIVAAIDAAVNDGVDILSLSIGGGASEFYKDTMSIALFGAVRAGVFVACSAGNFGPLESSLSNVAPWITTVGAATVDRVFPVSATLGNGQVLTGQSLYAQAAKQTPMVRLLPSDCTGNDLVPDRIMGKIVVCSSNFGVSPPYGVAVQRAGGSGLVSVATVEQHMDGLMVQAFTLPAVSLSAREAEKLAAYIHSEPYPVASFRFTCSTVTGENRAPMVATFSSRGPNQLVREILKPDVIAPGTNILAAWPGESPLTRADGDTRRSSFNIISGTSMACPHVAGVAALLKKKHPDWTPAMVRSALMTTATMLDSHGRPITDNARPGGSTTPMAAGAGLVRPQLALYPGLVYDAVEQDYVDFFCTMNYTTAQIRMFVPDFSGCTRTLPGGVGDLNYPSFVVDFSNGTDVRVLTRNVTRVSEGPEIYTVRVVVPDELVAVTVTPATLEFGELNETKSYKVVFQSKNSSAGAHGAGSKMQFGHIVWENDAHRVRSPVVFTWN